MRSSKRIRIFGLTVGIVVAAAAAVMLFFIGPSNVWGMLRYDQRREGDLKVGHRAPDLSLTTLDGTTRTQLLEHAGERPLVVIFGSFT